MRVLRFYSLVLLAAIAGCGSSTEPPGGGGGGGGGGTTVSVGDNFFSPNTTQATVGQAVTWNWVGNVQHNVTFDSGDPGSGNQSSGSFQHTFQATGTHTYFCSIHGRAVMSGTVEVSSPAGGGGGSGSGSGDDNPGPGY